jgi:putative membrane protein
MRCWKQGLMALIAATSMVACAGDTDRTAATRDNPGGTPGATGTAGAANLDRDFVEDMIEDGMAEITLGQLAQQRASNPQVREFGDMMVRDHQKTGDELKQISSRHNLQLDTTLDDDHNDLRERLSKLSGAEFDREYINAMVEEHQEAVDDVREKAENADNVELKQWAAQTLPTLQSHLEQARQLKNTLDQRQ